MADSTTPVDDLIKSQIPTWNQLFNQNSQCECDECESMIGAPAYLAHILHFAEQCQVNDYNATPYDVLIKRAPYLPFLPLTCINTNTELPYIQVVLEILEFFASKRTISNMPAYDSGSMDWESSYLETSQNAYKVLSTQCYPFSLPYHQPLDVIRTYLSKSKTSFAEMLSVFNYQDANIELRLVKECLTLSDEEYSLLTAFKIENDSFDVFKLYGFNNVTDFQKALFGDQGIKEFLQATGLLYAELIDLLNTKFINPGIDAVNFIQKLFEGENIAGSDLYAILKDIKNTPANEAGLNAKIQDLLAKSNNSGLDLQAFKSYLDKNFTLFQQTIIIIPTIDDPCNFTISRLGSILSSNDLTVTNPIDDDSFKRVYLFIRVLRKTGLKIKELDVLLNAMSGKGNDALINSIAYFNRLKERFHFSAAQFICLAGNTNPNETDSVYAQLFLNGALKNINSDFRSDDFGNFFSKPVMLKTNGKYNALLLSALSISEEEMDSLITFLTIPDPTNFSLSIESISVFYSYVLLSNSINIPLSVMLSLIKVFGKPDVLRIWDKVNSKFIEANLSSTKAFSEFVDVINDSVFSIKELLYVLGANDNDPTFQISTDKIQSTLVELQQNLIAQNLQNPVVEDKDINENLVTNKLLLLYDKDIVGQLIGMLNNKIVYGINLPLKPDLTIPASLSKISYDKTSGRLEVIGVLTLSDKTIISADNQLDVALKPIWDKSSAFLENNFSEFILDENAVNTLLDRIGNQTTSFFDKLKYFYSLYQPYLIKQLGYKSIIEKVAVLISLSEKITLLISKEIIDDLYRTTIDITKEISTTTGYFPDTRVNDFKGLLNSLNKGAVFISKFSLTANEINYFLNKNPDFSKIDCRDFNLQQWQQINNYCCLKKISKTSELSFIDLFSAASLNNSVQFLVNYISLLTGWQKDEVNSIIVAYNYDSTFFKNESTLIAISRMIRVSGKTSIKASLFAEWSKSDTQFDSLFALASQIKNEILMQYVPIERNDIEAKMSNDLLENQRNALVDYILTMDEIKKEQVTNVNELCGYLLIDVPMSSSMPTTRIRQGISTVQFFFKRIQMGTESAIDKTTKKEFGVSPKQLNNSVWEPKSFFRTWQVTMEFLTNPYPYLSYKYLIEKSEAAKVLEATLLKSDITPSTVEDAYRVYLQEICETSNLEIAAMYIDDSIDVDNNPSTKFIHVICKTRSAPHKYYYCTKNESDRWSFLENIPVAIIENDGEGKEPSGSHLIFTKFRDRYYLFMPEFVKRQGEQKKGSDTTTLKSLSESSVNNISLSMPVFHEIKLGVSELFQGKWSKKTYLTLQGDWQLLNNPQMGKPRDCIFNVKINKDLSGSDTDLNLNLFNTCYGIFKMTFYSINYPVILSSIPNSYETESGFYQNINLSELRLPVPEKDNVTIDVLNNAASELFISFSAQYSNTLKSVYKQPFFLYDNQKSYYVTAEPFMYVEPEPSAKFDLKAYDFLATLKVIKDPSETIFLPFHTQQIKIQNNDIQL
ncbi:neuraminidase-like domain-containing protein [Chitinophagaceae bacterium LWZ2-11]